jgi:hypothetical protein
MYIYKKLKTVLGFIKSNALEKAVKKNINDKMASWNWEMDNLDEPCWGLNQKMWLVYGYTKRKIERDGVLCEDERGGEEAYRGCS